MSGRSGIQKGGFFEKFEDLKNTKYLMNALKNRDLILNKIKKGLSSKEIYKIMRQL